MNEVRPLLKAVSVASLAVAVLILPLGATSANAAGPTPIIPDLYSCSVGASAPALDLIEAALPGAASLIAWSGSCTYVARGIQSQGALVVSVSSKGGSVNASVTCTLGSASASADSPGASGSVGFTHTGSCTLTAYGLGYGSASGS